MINTVGHLEHHLKPFFGETRINRITFDSVEQLIIHLSDKEKTKPKRKKEIPGEKEKAHQPEKKAPIALDTQRKILITLGSIMTYATRKRYIDYNPVRDVEKPKGQSEHDGDGDLNILNPEQIRLLLEHTPEIRYRTLFMTAALTGMRQGELFGLKWTDMDWINRQAHVNRTFNHGRFYEPKTKGSKRKIDLAPQLVTHLKEWRLGCPKGEIDLVFPNEDGKPLSPINMVRRKYEPALKAAGLQRIRFHDLRHTFASLLIDQGEHPKYIQSQMGHASINITMDTYGHLMKSTNEDAAARLGKAVFEPTGSKMVAEDTKGSRS
jgi:integrase